ncbi:MAG: hypothetical protein R3C14_51270 [Caldilineaceae bacterium]
MLNSILWPVGGILNWLLISILLYGLVPTGLYSTCTSMIEIPSPITPLLTSNPCLQRWFAFEFFWVGMIIGEAVGFVQWRFVIRHINLPKTWISINTISWAVGGALAYLLYSFCLHNSYSQIVPFLAQDTVGLTLFTWVLMMSELISCVGEQWLLSKNGLWPNYWLLSNLLGVGSAGIVGFLLPNWLPTIGYVGLWVGVTSGFTLWYDVKHPSREIENGVHV